jgi:hypothetical protein
MQGAYKIIDEPRPGRWSRIVVDPLWPLFAFMFGGPVWGWAWFIVNGQALGSPTRLRELMFVVLGVCGILGLSVVLGSLMMAGIVTKESMPYAVLVFTLWKLGISYWLYELQSRSFELYRYFGGSVQNGVIVVVLAYFFRPKLSATPDNALWFLLVS